MLQQTSDYPQWYRTFRAFLLGVAIGVILFSGLQQANVIPTSQPRFSYLIMMLFVQFPLMLILSAFEIGFRVMCYRRLRREMENPAATS